MEVSYIAVLTLLSLVTPILTISEERALTPYEQSEVHDIEIIPRNRRSHNNPPVSFLASKPSNTCSEKYQGKVDSIKVQNCPVDVLLALGKKGYPEFNVTFTYHFDNGSTKAENLKYTDPTGKIHKDGTWVRVMMRRLVIKAELQWALQFIILPLELEFSLTYHIPGYEPVSFLEFSIKNSEHTAYFKSWRERCDLNSCYASVGLPDQNKAMMQEYSKPIETILSDAKNFESTDVVIIFDCPVDVLMSPINPAAIDENTAFNISLILHFSAEHTVFNFVNSNDLRHVSWSKPTWLRFTNLRKLRDHWFTEITILSLGLTSAWYTTVPTIANVTAFGIGMAADSPVHILYWRPRCDLCRKSAVSFICEDHRIEYNYSSGFSSTAAAVIVTILVLLAVAAAAYMVLNSRRNNRPITLSTFKELFTKKDTLQ